jgi:phosphopantothenoylcysteine decarboxylase/phosphopantothenate--cysteine ligase
MLIRKKIILGVTGSIAAYKSAPLTRLLIKQGAEVRVVLTESARDFVTPLTLSTLSKNPVESSFTTGEKGQWVNHVEMGLWADAFLIAPASAFTISSCANGLAGNLLTAIYLSARCPVFFAPAMDLDMWKHPSTTENIAKLRSFGNLIIEPGIGELASGLVGEGRMSEPEEIVSFLDDYFSSRQQFKGKRIIITAGPTREPIDAVRFISNHSSGKMGYALAEELASRGAHVILVSGPTERKLNKGSIELIHVETAQQMADVVLHMYDSCHAAILSAAVADYRPKYAASGKIKKDGEVPQIELEETTDILFELGKRKKEGQFLGGFALETSNGRAHAEQKLHKKNLDFIVLNVLSDENPVFNNDENQIEILLRDKQWKTFPKMQKAEAASFIADTLNNLIREI